MAKLTLNGVTHPEIPHASAAGGLSLALEDKELLVLVGPAGSGKSALFRIISGLAVASGGVILVEEKNVDSFKAVQDREIAMVFPDGALYPQKSVHDNLAFGMSVRKVPKPEMARRIAEAASILGIEPLLARKAGSLGSLDTRRVALGRAMVRKPKVILLDAPLSGLQPGEKSKFQAEVIQLQQRLQATMLYSTADPMEALAVGTRLVVIREGIIQQEGTPADVYLKPANVFVAGYFGHPPMDLIHGKLKEVSNQIQFREQGEGSIACMLPESAAARNFAGREVVLGIRPEQVRPVLADSGSGQADTGRQAGVLIKGLVDLIEPRGAETLVHFQTGAHALTSRCEAFLDSSHMGHRMQFELDLSKAILFDPESQLRIA